MWRAVLKPWAWDARKNAWILEATWILVDDIVSVRQFTTKYQSLIQRLGRAITARLKGDRKLLAEEAGAEVEKLLGSDLYHPFNRCQDSWWSGGLIQVASPPLLLPLLPTVSYLLSSSP